jgi:hypothetical protein
VDKFQVANDMSDRQIDGASVATTANVDNDDSSKQHA